MLQSWKTSITCLTRRYSKKDDASRGSDAMMGGVYRSLVKWQVYLGGYSNFVRHLESVHHGPQTPSWLAGQYMLVDREYRRTH